jgi:gamma-glutamyltranspeptidase/glutathione hydrolase
MIASHMVASRSQVTGENGVVVGGHPFEAEAGIAALRAGGNAMDAVVAAAFAGFVVEPASCGLGGYGHLAAFVAKDKSFLTVDHYVRAPAAARPDMFAIDRAKPMKYYGFPYTVGMKAEIGHLAPAVPGAVAGLVEAHGLVGRLKLSRVLEPAIEIARQGVPVTWNLALTVGDRLADIQAHPHAAALLLRQGRPPKAPGPLGGGDVLDTSDLARTLTRIADFGAAGFHDGPVAEAIERECVGHGGILTLADLRAYRPRILKERPCRYRHLDYVTAYDQVAYEALNILDCFDLKSWGRDSANFRHVMAEALAAAFVDNMTHYGDPDHVKSPVAGLTSRDFAAKRAAGIELARTLPRPVRPADPWPYDDPASSPTAVPLRPSAAKLAGTSQMAAADRDGNLVTLITSLTSGFGSLVLVPGTGVFLNNSMQNFDPRPEQANAIAPGKMPIFAAPALVAAADGRVAFGACGSGGYRIETAVLHSFVNRIDFGLSVQSSVDAPRVHCQGQSTYIDGRIPADVQERLRAIGHDLVIQFDDPGANCFGRVCAIGYDGSRWAAGSGPAWGTAAAGY